MGGGGHSLVGFGRGVVLHRLIGRGAERHTRPPNPDDFITRPPQLGAGDTRAEFPDTRQPYLAS